MITTYKDTRRLPYSLHDMRANHITIDGNSLRFKFENGFCVSNEPYEEVKGTLTITGIDWDFAHIYLLSEYGKEGAFTGRKMALPDFLKEYKNYTLEILDDCYHGYNVIFDGYLYQSDTEVCLEYHLSLWHDGEMRFETEDK